MGRGIDEQAFDLVEHGGVGLVAVASEGSSCGDNFQGRFCLDEGSDLDG